MIRSGVFFGHGSRRVCYSSLFASLTLYSASLFLVVFL